MSGSSASTRALLSAAKTNAERDRHDSPPGSFRADSPIGNLGRVCVYGIGWVGGGHSRSPKVRVGERMRESLPKAQIPGQGKEEEEKAGLTASHSVFPSSLVSPWAFMFKRTKSKNTKKPPALPKRGPSSQSVMSHKSRRRAAPRLGLDRTPKPRSRMRAALG